MVAFPPDMKSVKVALDAMVWTLSRCLVGMDKLWPELLSKLAPESMQMLRAVGDQRASE